MPMISNSSRNCVATMGPDCSRLCCCQLAHHHRPPPTASTAKTTTTSRPEEKTNTNEPEQGHQIGLQINTTRTPKQNKTNCKLQATSNTQNASPLSMTHILFVLALVLVHQLMTQCPRRLARAQLSGTQYHQHNNILHFVVPEGAPNNTYVGNIRSADGQPPYLVLPAPQTPEHERMLALNVNLTNGDLHTNSVLDREHREQYHFVAIVKEPFAEIKCTVTVKDVNDNAPMFLLSSNETNFVIEMPEGQRGVRKLLPLAIDFDTPQYGIKEFRIVSGNTPSGMFQLVEHEAPARSPALLQQSQMGPNEDAAMLAAGDNPQLMQQLAQQASVLIPSQPMMQSGSLSNSLSGALAGGVPLTLSSVVSSSPSSMSSLGSMAATSITANSISLLGQAPPTQSKFLIDLEVSQPLDRENQSSYQLVVEAIDGGQPPLLGKLMVTVNVQDVNDNDPVFSRKFYECQFREDTARGTLLLRVQAQDADLDSNGQISYFIKRHSSSSQQQQQQQNNNNSSDNIEIASNRFTTNANGNSILNLNNNKQRPQQQQPGLPTATVNANANKLQRQQSGSSSGGGNEIYENSVPSSSSSSSSSSAEGLLSYKTKGSYVAGSASPSDQLFEMDPVKGEIYLVHQLDFETDQTHELLIEARDHGKPSRSSFAIVKIFVLDVNDDPPPSMNRFLDDRGRLTNAQVPSSEASRSESSPTSRFSNDLADISQNYLQNFNLTSWFAQVNSSLLFVMVLVVLFAVAFSVCLVKIKSRQPESDYNDTAGLTLTPNNGQTKPSPNHSTSNEHSNGSSDSHHRHHDHQRRLNGGPFAGLNGATGGTGFGTPNGKLRYQYIDSSNLYHNPHPQQHHPRLGSHHNIPPDSPIDHQMAPNQGSRGGTMKLHNHSHNHNHTHTPLLGSPALGHHHSLEHHHHQFADTGHHQAHHTSSLTYAHHQSRAALLHHTHHHQSSHHLSSVHHTGGQIKGGTMNSVATHHSAAGAAHPSGHSPLPATPNTTHSSGLPPNMHETGAQQHQHNGHHGPHLNLPQPPQSSNQLQLPPTPTGCNAPPGGVFSWPQDPSGCFGPPVAGSGGPLHVTPGSTMDRSCVSPGAGTISQPLDRWFDLGLSSQLVYAHDWYGSYNWDYLSDWTPDYHTLMPLVQADASGY